MRIIEDFKVWFNENKGKFICKPYIYKDRTNNKRKKYLELRFENIIPEVYVHVNQHEIAIWADISEQENQEIIDQIADFLVAERITPKGKYYNGLHIKPKKYNTLKEVYYEEFDYFLRGVNSLILKENFLVFCWNNGIRSARIINPEKQPEIFQAYQASSNKTGYPPTYSEFLLSNLVNLDKEKIISGEREKQWETRVIKLSVDNV